MQIITGLNKKIPPLRANSRRKKEDMETLIKLIHTRLLSNNGGRENEQ
jgi:hypothetical protein